MGINVVIILGIVFVAGGREKDRIEVDGFHPQFLQIIQPVDHALQVSAVEFPIAVGPRGPVPVPDCQAGLSHIAVFSGQHIVGRISVAEAVDEDLVHHGALRPGGRMEAGNDMPPVHSTDRIPHTAAGVFVISSVNKDLKIIAQGRPVHLKLHRVIVKTSVRLTFAHAQMLSALCHEKTGLCLSLQHAEPYGDLLIQVRLRGCNIIFCCITEKSTFSGAFPIVSIVKHPSVS